MPIQVTKIVVSCRQTINMGSYETVSPGVSVEAAVGPDDDPRKVYKQASFLARELWVMETLAQAATIDWRRQVGLLEFAKQFIAAAHPDPIPRPE